MLNDFIDQMIFTNLRYGVYARDEVVTKFTVSSPIAKGAIIYVYDDRITVKIDGSKQDFKQAHAAVTYLDSELN